MARPTLPDTLAAAIAHLAADPDVAAIVAEGIGSRLPARARLPFLAVSRIGGGADVHAFMDHARLQVDCWARGEEEAFALARAAHAALVALSGPAQGAVVGGVETTLGFRSLPDPDTGWERVAFEVLVHAHR